MHNKTKKTKLSSNVKVLTSSWDKGIGLMFSKEKDDFALVFVFNKPQIVPLHMWFVFYPIDVLFLDEDKLVVDMKENFKPFTLHTSKEKVKYIVELPNGIIRKSKTQKGNLIDW